MTPETIILIIEYLTCISINTKNKKREIVEVRQISQYVLRFKLGLKYRVIGELCGNKDHATVIHSCKIVDDLRLNNEYKEKYQGLFNILAI